MEGAHKDPLERAWHRRLVVLATALVTLVAASALIFILRGWAGYFPSKLSTSGAEYGERPSLADLSELSAAVADLRSSYMDTAQATREVLEYVAGGTDDKDDML